MSKKKRTIEVKDHWRGELTKVRCWLEGYRQGTRAVNGGLPYLVPGEDTLRQIIMAIDDAKDNKNDSE